jgi:hypothetical protein
VSPRRAPRSSAGILAEAGYLDGRPATSHWLGLIGLRRSNPEVRWRDDVRYVDDGDIVTSAGVLSGIDGTLRAVERLAGETVAAKAAKAVHWPFYTPGRPASLEPPHLAPSDTIGLLSAAYRWDREQLGVVLTDGVGETELASAFRGYTENNFLADPLAITDDGTPIQSAHGLTFVPRLTLQGARSLVDRIIIPGIAPSDHDAVPSSLIDDIPVSYPHAEPGFAFDGILEDIAGHHDNASARWAAKTLQYPTTGLDLDGSPWPWATTTRFVVLTALGMVIAVAGLRLWRAMRRHPNVASTHAAGRKDHE